MVRAPVACRARDADSTLANGRDRAPLGYHHVPARARARPEDYVCKAVNLPPDHHVSRALYSSPVFKYKGHAHVFWGHCGFTTALENSYTNVIMASATEFIQRSGRSYKTVDLSSCELQADRIGM